MSIAEAVAARTEEIEAGILQESPEATAFRNMIKQVSGRNISSVQAQQFLDIFGYDLDGEITHTKRLFIEKHFGKK